MLKDILETYFSMFAFVQDLSFTFITQISHHDKFQLFCGRRIKSIENFPQNKSMPSSL